MFCASLSVQIGANRSRRQEWELKRPHLWERPDRHWLYGLKGDTAAVHSRQGRDVSKCGKQALTVCCCAVLLADKTASQQRCQNIWARQMASLLEKWLNFFFLIAHLAPSPCFCEKKKRFYLMNEENQRNLIDPWSWNTLTSLRLKSPSCVLLPQAHYPPSWSLTGWGSNVTLSLE